MNRSKYLATLLFSCAIVYTVLVLVYRRDCTGFECFSADTTASLSIHMVVVPFLRYHASNEAILEREKDYKLALQKNLAHPLVKCVHLLTTNFTETSERFKNVSNNSKLLVSEVESVDLARDPFDYISKHLLGRDVIFATADVYLGAGFDRVDPVVMDRKKIMYSVSRHVSPAGKGLSRLSHISSQIGARNTLARMMCSYFDCTRRIPSEIDV